MCRYCIYYIACMIPVLHIYVIHRLYINYIPNIRIHMHMCSYSFINCTYIHHYTKLLYCVHYTIPYIYYTILCYTIGNANIKVRITDISKNHQKKLFSILICPDKGMFIVYQCILLYVCMYTYMHILLYV